MQRHGLFALHAVAVIFCSFWNFRTSGDHVPSIVCTQAHKQHPVCAPLHPPPSTLCPSSLTTPSMRIPQPSTLNPQTCALKLTNNTTYVRIPQLSTLHSVCTRHPSPVLSCHYRGNRGHGKTPRLVSPALHNPPPQSSKPRIRYAHNVLCLT